MITPSLSAYNSHSVGECYSDTEFLKLCQPHYTSLLQALEIFTRLHQSHLCTVK